MNTFNESFYTTDFDQDMMDFIERVNIKSLIYSGFLIVRNWFTGRVIITFGLMIQDEVIGLVHNPVATIKN